MNKARKISFHVGVSSFMFGIIDIAPLLSPFYGALHLTIIPLNVYLSYFNYDRGG